MKTKPFKFYNPPVPVDLYRGSVEIGPRMIAVGAAMLQYIWHMWYEPGYSLPMFWSDRN